MGLSETVLERQLELTLRACVALGNTWFTRPTLNEYTYQSAFHIATVAAAIDGLVAEPGCVFFVYADGKWQNPVHSRRKNDSQLLLRKLQNNFWALLVYDAVPVF
jgi:hypothetical protein